MLVNGYQIFICPDISYKVTKPDSKLLSIERQSVCELKGQKEQNRICVFH